VAERAAWARGAWRGIEATVAPLVNPVAVHVQPTSVVNSLGHEGLWQLLHEEARARMDAVDRALHDRDLKAMATAAHRVGVVLDQASRLAAVSDIGNPRVPAEPELVMMLAGLKRIDLQLDVVNVCLGRLSQEGGTEQQREERLSDVAEQVALVKGVWWGVDATVTNFIDPDGRQNGQSHFSSSEREGLYRELKLGTEASVGAISKALQDGNLQAMAGAIWDTRRQFDRTRQAIVNVQLMPHRNGSGSRPIAL
jgi:hypothetical protein